MCMFERAPALVTERLTLRSVRPEDASRIAGLCADADIPRMTSRMPWPYEPKHAEQFLAAMAAADPERDQVFAIDHPDHGMIGTVGLHVHERLPELGYWLGRDYWGRGFATEAARGALIWARENWGSKVVTAGHFADNPASGAVLVKAGFLYTGDVELKPSLARGEPVPTRMMIWLA